ncbi:MAG: RecQ family ATP-dependent DNA helicase [Bacteroidales bacterium]|nr:RecQ family ATP-dependent DNA helicase [Bacteroidales bacterium]
MSEFTRSVLKRYWGYPSFRPLQEEIVDAVVAGRDTLALLPTGGGKSICFQVPAMAMEGICVVVTPLIALMKDQVAHLLAKRIPAAAIYSGMHPDQVELTYNQAVYGRLKFLYVSPERLQTDLFLEAIKRMKVNLLAVDESHCISQWGYDFRPPYLKIAELRPYIPKTPVLALTATATSKVVDDIQYRLGFKQKNVFRSSFERKNLTYNVYHEPDKFGVLYRKLHALQQGSAIVYVRNRKKTQVIAEWLQSVGVPATFYHAGLDSKTRDERQDLWMRGKVSVMVSTNAFGMGIDKPDVRLVIHLDLPDSIEAYFQEAGRAGRDLQPAEAFLLVSDADVKQLEDNFQQSYPDMDRIKRIYNALGSYLKVPVGAGEGESYPFDLGDFARTYNLGMMETFSALKMFEKEGMMVLSESFDEPSKVWIKAPRDDLYRFQVAFPQFDTLIKYMLRSLPGVLSDFVRFNEETAALKTGLTVDQVIALLKKMESYNFLSYDPRKDKPQLQLVTEFLDTRYFTLSNETYLDRKKDAEARIKAVIGFVNNDQECRSIQLLRYFDEVSRKPCGQCDVCVSHGSGDLSAGAYDQISHEVLDALDKKPMSVREILEACHGHEEEEVMETVRWMIDNGQLVIEGEMLRLKTKKETP